MERNRLKPVGRDKGSLTEQQTKGTVRATIQIRRKTQHKPHNPESRSPRPLRTLPSHERVPAAQLPLPLEPSMMAHGMEYPALFGQVGSAHPAVSLSWIPVKINPVLAEPRTSCHQKLINSYTSV